MQRLGTDSQGVVCEVGQIFLGAVDQSLCLIKSDSTDTQEMIEGGYILNHKGERIELNSADVFAIYQAIRHGQLKGLDQGWF